MEVIPISVAVIIHADFILAMASFALVVVSSANARACNPNSFLRAPPTSLNRDDEVVEEEVESVELAVTGGGVVKLGSLTWYCRPAL